MANKLTREVWMNYDYTRGPEKVQASYPRKDGQIMVQTPRDWRPYLTGQSAVFETFEEALGSLIAHEEERIERDEKALARRRANLQKLMGMRGHQP